MYASWQSVCLPLSQPFVLAVAMPSVATYPTFRLQLHLQNLIWAPDLFTQLITQPALLQWCLLLIVIECVDFVLKTDCKKKFSISNHYFWKIPFFSTIYLCWPVIVKENNDIIVNCPAWFWGTHKSLKELLLNDNVLVLGVPIYFSNVSTLLHTKEIFVLHNKNS